MSGPLATPKVSSGADVPDTFCPLSLSAEEEALIAGLSEYDRERTRWRRRALAGFAAEIRARRFVGRVGIAKRYIARLKARNPEASVSISSLWRWAQRYRTHGILGLTDWHGPGRPSRERTLRRLDAIEDMQRDLQRRLEALGNELAAVRGGLESPRA